MKTTLTALAGLLVLASSASSQAGPRLVITPSTRSVVAGDSVQFAAQLVDESGKPVPDSRVTSGAPDSPSRDASIRRASSSPVQWGRCPSR